MAGLVGPGGCLVLLCLVCSPAYNKQFDYIEFLEERDKGQRISIHNESV